MTEKINIDITEQEEPRRPNDAKNYSQSSEKQEVDWEEKYKRLAADFSNYKKRVDDNYAAMERRLQAQYLKNILPIYDDFIRLDGHTKDANGLTACVQAVQQKWQQWLQENEIEIINPKGELFDHEFHDAILQEPVLDPELDGKVTNVIELGYLYRHQVLRHAKVAVGRFEDKNDSQNDFEEDENRLHLIN